ncbi:MAG TPA: hypothetical protein ACHBZA_05770 [Arsenophonus apicola]|uniref:hypothetical protein n=1 Tax=Arsenophonus endosymbiont of Apis mellifera TaxID=1541805 RepID=UPI0015D85520|nr:hypothetical protein [Arsenophonus endosymbiont of Apis mellifera]
MTKKDVQLNIRMTQELKKKIEMSAKINNRTTNAEAITLIEYALNDIKPKEFGDRIKNAAEEISMQINLSPNEIERLINEILAKETRKVLSHSLDEILSKSKLLFLQEVEKHRKN